MSSPFSISNRLMGTKHYSEKAQRILVEGIYNQIESIDDGWSCIRSLAIAEVELNKAQRGEIFSKLRNVFFFQHCKVEQLRTFLDLYNRSFGNLPCQDAISGAYLRLLSERQVHLFVKVQLSLDLMTKFLMVYRTQQNLELNEQLFVAPLKYLNSSITLLSIHQKLNLYYLNNIFDYSTDAEIEEIEKWVSENKDVVLKNISLDLAVKLIWSLGTHRYKKNLYDIDNFLVVFRDLSPEQIIISEMLIEYLENNYSRMNTDQKHR